MKMLQRVYNLREENVINGDECKVYDGNLIVARLDVIKLFFLLLCSIFCVLTITSILGWVGKFVKNPRKDTEAFIVKFVKT